MNSSLSEYKVLILGSLLIAVAGCSQPNRPASKKSTIDKSIIYAEATFPFKIENEIFNADAKQLDLTEEARRQGDTLSRPTYACVISIADSRGKTLFSDSLLRSSWGYPGKIKRIDAYELAMPLITAQDKSIFFSFKIYEKENLDAIEGIVSFNVATGQADYSWKEALK